MKNVSLVSTSSTSYGMKPGDNPLYFHKRRCGASSDLLGVLALALLNCGISLVVTDCVGLGSLFSSICHAVSFFDRDGDVFCKIV